MMRVDIFIKLVLRQKLNRAAESVNRECGTENAIGGGSGELLDHIRIIDCLSDKTFGY